VKLKSSLSTDAANDGTISGAHAAAIMSVHHSGKCQYTPATPAEQHAYSVALRRVTVERGRRQAPSVARPPRRVNG
jgi:hypothetical protein